MSQDFFLGSRRRLIRFQCLTEYHRLEGTITMSSRRLVDFLNGDSAEDSVAADDVTVQVGPDGGEESSAVGRIDIGTDNILLVIPIEDGPPPLPDMSVRSMLSIERVLLGIGPYLVMGDAYLPKSTRGRGLIRASEKRFIMLTDAVVKHKTTPGYAQQARAVCVNRRNVEFIGTVIPKT